MDRCNLTFEKCGSLSLMHLKYSMGSFKTQSKEAIYHKLTKPLKFCATEIHVHITVKRVLRGL